MRNSNTVRRLVGTVAAGAVGLTACLVVMFAPTSADAVNSLKDHHSAKIHSLGLTKINSL